MDKEDRIGRPVVLASVGLVLHILANGNYGFFGDELYFIVCGMPA